MSQTPTLTAADERMALSSNQFSLDQQVQDVVTWLSANLDGFAGAFAAEFPEYTSLVWIGGWVDPHASKVDVDFMTWVADWIEAHSAVMWEDGEPWLYTYSATDEDWAP